MAVLFERALLKLMLLNKLTLTWLSMYIQKTAYSGFI